MPVQWDAIGRFAPRTYVEGIERTLDLAGINIRPDAFLGMVIVGGVSASILAFLVLSVLGVSYSWLFAIGFGGASVGLTYAGILLRIEDRKNKVETVLPEFLQLASANVRAGMPIDRALWFAARPEFGLLSEEIELVTKRTFGGETFVKAIRRLPQRFQSKALERSVNLLIEGTASGGEVADLLEKTGWDIRNMQLLHAEISGMLLMYIIFIVFASTLGAPILYGLSNQLINITNTIWAGILEQNPEGLPSGGMMFLQPQPPGVGADDFFLFALVSTIMTTTLASFIIATIQSGYTADGVKIAPFMICGGLSVFFVVNWLFQMIFVEVLPGVGT